MNYNVFWWLIFITTLASLEPILELIFLVWGPGLIPSENRSINSIREVRPRFADSSSYVVYGFGAVRMGAAVNITNTSYFRTFGRLIVGWSCNSAYDKNCGNDSSTSGDAECCARSPDERANQTDLGRDGGYCNACRGLGGSGDPAKQSQRRQE